MAAMISQRRAVDENLTVGKYPASLHGNEQFLVSVGGRQRVRLRYFSHLRGIELGVFAVNPFAAHRS